MNTNTESTRFYSDAHEKSICRALNGTQSSNSGAGHFHKGDVTVPHASLLVEAKTTMTEKASVSIKKEWLEKNKDEAFDMRLSNSALCFNFGPNTDNYYVISEKLMKFLVQKLSDENR